MKCLSLKVMTLLMAALVLSASGCFNDEMSSPEGTVKGFYRAWNQKKVKKMLTYCDPREMTEACRKDAYNRMRDRKWGYGRLEVVKTTLVSKKQERVMEGGRWTDVMKATVEARVKGCMDHGSHILTIRLVMLNQRWHIAHFRGVYICHPM